MGIIYSEAMLKYACVSISLLIERPCTDIVQRRRCRAFATIFLQHGVNKPHNIGSQVSFTEENVIMIVFDRLWETMKNKGVTTYTLREKYKFDSRKLRRL